MTPADYESMTPIERALLEELRKFRVMFDERLREIVAALKPE